MNDSRRKQIDEAIGLIEQAKELISNAGSEEREYFDNMHENLQGGEKGQKADEAAGYLEEAESSCDEIIGNLENAKE